MDSPHWVSTPMRAPLRTKRKAERQNSLKLSRHRAAGPGGAFAAGEVHARPRPWPQKRPLPQRVLTLHDWEAKHYVIAAVIILVVMGMFAYSWS